MIRRNQKVDCRSTGRYELNCSRALSSEARNCVWPAEQSSFLSSRLPSSNHRRRDTCNRPLTPNRISAISQNLARRFCGRLHSSSQRSIDLFPPFPPSLHQASQHCRGFPCPPCKFLQALSRVIICFIFFHLAICPLHQRPIISPAIWCLFAPSILRNPNKPTDRLLRSIRFPPLRDHIAQSSILAPTTDRRHGSTRHIFRR